MTTPARSAVPEEDVIQNRAQDNEAEYQHHHSHSTAPSRLDTYFGHSTLRGYASPVCKADATVREALDFGLEPRGPKRLYSRGTVRDLSGTEGIHAASRTDSRDCYSRARRRPGAGGLRNALDRLGVRSIRGPEVAGVCRGGNTRRRARV